MVTKKLFLYFPKSETEKPIIYQLVTDYKLVVNIFAAKVTPEEYGYLVLDVSGKEKDIKAAIDYLTTLKVEVNEGGGVLRWDSSKCAHCTNCTPHCPTHALSIKDRNTMEISFDKTLCVECLSCIPNCPFAALSSAF